MINSGAGSLVITGVLLCIITLCGCQDDAATPLVSDPGPREISLSGVGPQGIFDPSLAYDPATGLLWMSYSEVSASTMWPDRNLAVESRLAWSNDAGGTWTDFGEVVNPALDVTLPLAPPNNAGTWEQEVPALVRDPGAQPAERWKLIWMRYLQVNRVPVYQHGWIALKTAPSPTGPWSAERKLFVGAGYDTINNLTIGPPEIHVDLLAPELGGVVLVAEPGLLATDTALYVTLLAAEGGPRTGRIALFKWPHPAGPWQYLGSFLDNAVDGPPFGYQGFSAPELFEQGGIRYLIVTPQNNDLYQGTMVFVVSDLETASLQRVGGRPVLVLEIQGEVGTHNGAAGYIAEATASGLIYSQVDPRDSPLFFRIFQSRRAP